MKKFTFTIILCFSSLVANAGEFECTVSKAMYINALRPLVPKLVKNYKKGNSKAIALTEKHMKKYVTYIFEDCENIKSRDQLNKVLNELAKGTILFVLSNKNKE